MGHLMMLISGFCVFYGESKGGLSLVLSEAYFGLADHFALFLVLQSVSVFLTELSDFDVCLVVADNLFIETESVAKIGFCFVSNLKATDALLLETLAREEVEDVLDVFDAVDVAVDIDIAVIGVDGTDKFRLLETETPVSLNWADVLLFGYNVVKYVAIVERNQVAWLARRKVYHCPHAAGISERRTVGTMD